MKTTLNQFTVNGPEERNNVSQAPPALIPKRFGVRREGPALISRTPLSFGDKVSRGLWHLDSEGLCALAMRSTGLEDFGSPPLTPALSILLNSLEDEANLHPLGRLLMRIHLRDLLATRLRLADAWKGRLDR